MRVPFTHTQIILTNLIEGVYPPYTASSSSLSGTILSVAKLAASDPLFQPGSVLASTATRSAWN